MRAVQVQHIGGPEVMTLVEMAAPVPEPGQIVVEVAAAGVNFIDTYFRSGLYPRPMPFVNGSEGAGVVVAVGSDSGADGSNGGIAVGDRVAWSAGPGSYAEQVAINAADAVPVPDDVSLDMAAAVMLQGMTAHYLATSTWPLEPGQRCLVHAAAGGVGALLVQIAKMRGAEVFATVGSADKVAIAAAAGADHIINYNETDFAQAIVDIAGPTPLDVVYDGVGASTFDASIRLLRPRGMMVTFGNASGPVPPMAPLLLNTLGSLYLTRPKLNDYLQTRDELLARTADLFGWIADGSLDVRIGGRYGLEQAAQAHIDLESRSTIGKLLLIASTALNGDETH